MEAREFFNLVSRYVTHRDHASKEYAQCKTDEERKRCTRNHNAVLNDIWGQIVAEVRRVEQALAIEQLRDQERDLDGLQKIAGHIAERMRINGCELEYLKRERERIYQLIRQKENRS